MARTTNHYINNKTMFKEMIKYKEQCELAAKNNQEKPQISNYIGQCFMMICNNLSIKKNFIGYTYRDEMIADGIENCVIGAHNFDPTKSNNPFAYFTQIAWNAFIRRITKEKKQAYIKHKNYEHNILSDELWESQWGSNEGTINNDASNEIVRSFEDQQKKIVEKARIKHNRVKYNS